MKLVITGASGFIGSALVQQLWKDFHSLVLLSRNPRRQEEGSSTKTYLSWQPGQSGAWEQSVDGADGVINLAGEPIAGKRWSVKQKQKLRSSRIETTQALVSAIAKAKVKPKFFLSASAVGYYGDRGDELLTEESPPSNDFLGRLCADWEAEAKKAELYDIRVVQLRTGIVLGKDKGALKKMAPPFKMFFGGPLGSGQQWMPWIHIDDEVGLIKFLMEHESARGAFNLTAPNPVTMAEFAAALGKALNRPAWASVPSWVLALMLGEMADMLLGGQRAVPKAALGLGYRFKYPRIAVALDSLNL
ncbi:MAG: TIGR01777 family protein [Deltaproteobacteria bacterium]|nr:TIGR01777 family protein [Deltaproteobacteria bacterium]